MLIRKYVVPCLAIAGAALAAYTVRSENRPIQPAAPAAEPARSPYARPVAGAGIVEASTQNIEVGTQVAGVVTSVAVKVGDWVKAGEPLFALDDRTARAEWESTRAQQAVAEQGLARLRSMPRAEDLPPAEATVAEARAQLADAQAQLSLWESLTNPRAVSQDELNKRRFAVDVARARLSSAESRLALLKAGTWAPDLEVARAELEAARSRVVMAQAELDRLTVRAPCEGQVLQLNVRAGEFAPAGALATPLLLFGDTRTLHVRVDIDENDAWRIKPESRAHGSLRGNSALKTDLSFVRVEPYVVPKRSLTGDSSERVDTRVLQVIYAFPRGAIPAYVGQQMDIFVDAPPGATP